MKIIANENVFEPIIDFLRAEGYKVISVRGLSLGEHGTTKYIKRR